MALVQAFLNENTGFWQSLDMGDTDDSGGQASGAKIADGAIGVVLPPITNLEEVATGSYTARQIWAGLSTQDASVAYKCLAYISEPYDDPLINAFLVSLGDAPLTWAEARAKMEAFSVITGKTSIYLPYHAYKGMGTITLMSRVGVPPLRTGSIYALRQGDITEFISIKSLVSTQGQFEIEVNGSSRLETRVVYTVDVLYPLENDFNGSGLEVFDNSIGPAFIYSTQYNPAIRFNGIMRVAEDVIASNIVTVDNVMQNIIPSTRVETGFLPKNPTYDIIGLFNSGNGQISFRYYNNGSASKQVQTLTAIYPGTFKATTPASGVYITDDGNGVLMLSGKKVGTISYKDGLAELYLSGNVNFLSPLVQFEPATVTSQHPYHVAFPLTFNNTRRVFEVDLFPPPQPGSISFEYQWGGNVYRLIDTGAGKLQGEDESYGIGAFNASSNHLSVNLKYPPDADSAALVKWTTNTALINRANVPLPPMYYTLDMTDSGITDGLLNGSVTFSWYGPSGHYYTASASTDNLGQITGDATGTISPSGLMYSSGYWYINFVPVKTLASGTQITVTIIDENTASGQKYSFFNAFPNPDGLIHVNLSSLVMDGYHIDQSSVHVLFTAYLIFGDNHSPTGNQEYTTQVEYNAIGTGEDFTQTFVFVGDNEIAFSPKTFISVPVPHYKVDRNTRVSVIDYYINQNKPTSTPTSGLSGFVLFNLVPNNLSAFSQSITVTTAPPKIKLTHGFLETIALGSIRFRIGNTIFVDNDGLLNSFDQGFNGTLNEAGTVDYEAAEITINACPAEVTNSLSLESLATYYNTGAALIGEVSFYSDERPLIPGSVSISVDLALGGSLSIIPDETQVIDIENCQGTANFSTGLFNLRFGNWKVASSLTEYEKEEWWYNELDIINGNIWKPALVFPQTLRISGTAFTLIPSSRTRLGVNPALFPQSGTVAAVKTGDLVVLHDHIETDISGTITPGRQIMLRDNLAYGAVVDADGKTVQPSATTYTIDLKIGILEFSTNLNLSAYALPLKAIHKRAEPREVSGVDISGRVSVIPPFSQTFAAGSYLSAAVEFGNIQAYVPTGRMFSQATWSLSNPVWSDERIGAEPLLQFNRLGGYKIAVTNEGAITQRFALYFPTSLPEFICYGEDIGQINATAHPLGQVFAPINPATKTQENPDGVPYFVFPASALSGQSTGNVFFFTTIGAKRPIWPVRVINPSDSPPVAETKDFSLIFLCHPDKKEV